MQILSPGQSRLLSHSSRRGHSSLSTFTHLLRPLTVLAHKHMLLLPHWLVLQLLLLMAGSPSLHPPWPTTVTFSAISPTFPCALAMLGNRASSPLLPMIAAAVSLSALRREMVLAASSLATSSKSSMICLCRRLTSLVGGVPVGAGIVGHPSFPRASGSPCRSVLLVRILTGSDESRMNFLSIRHHMSVAYAPNCTEGDFS